MPKVPKFGAFMQSLREARSKGTRSRQAVVNQMESVGVFRDQSALARCETEGRVPAADLLRGLSFAYEIPFEDLVEMVLEELGVKPVEWRIRELHPREQRAWTHADDGSRRAAVAVLRLGRSGAHVGEPPPDRPPERIRLVDFLASADENAGAK